jgi:hypothetical protein
MCSETYKSSRKGHQMTAAKRSRKRPSTVTAVKPQVHPARPKAPTTRVVSTRLSDADIRHLERLAARERTTYSNKVRLIVEQYLAGLREAERARRAAARKAKAAA